MQELFGLEDSKAQVVLTAHNKKLLSVRQSEDLRANQTRDDHDHSDKETFQIEFLDKTENSKVSLVAFNRKYWSSANGRTVSVTGAGSGDPSCAFTMTWQEHSQVSLQ